MSFRRSSEEIEAFQEVLQEVEFTGENLSVNFRTTKDAVRDAIPPEFEIDGQPSVRVALGRFHSNCMAEFSGAVLSVGVKFNGVAARYPLIMYMDSDMALLFGREILSEPKKLGSITLEGDSRHAMSGMVSRSGQTLMRVQAVLDRDGPAAEGTSNVFNVRYSLDARATKFNEPPEVQLSTTQQNVTDVRLGRASLELNGTIHDPVDSLPILEIESAVYARVSMRVRTRPFGVLAPDGFLPLALGKSDYWPAFSSSTSAVTDRTVLTS
jgi:acetoacetate decarboxylase